MQNNYAYNGKINGKLFHKELPIANKYLCTFHAQACFGRRQLANELKQKQVSAVSKINTKVHIHIHINVNQEQYPTRPLQISCCSAYYTRNDC